MKPLNTTAPKRRLPKWRAAAALGASVLLAACSGTNGEAGEQTLMVALAGPPATLDPHASSGFIDQQIAWHVYEGLWTIDSEFQAQPMLAESGEYDEDGTTFTITLREGVKFHDGSDLDSDDVVASLQRWQESASYGGIFSAIVNDVSAASPTEVVLTMDAPSPALEQLLAFPNQQAAIMPSELIEEADGAPIIEPVGTGPYEFESQASGQYVRLAKYDDYAARDEAADGLAGKREALVDKLEFRPTPEVSVRRDQLVTGEINVAQSLQPDMLSEIEGAANVTPVIVKPYWWSMAVFDKSEPPFDDKNVRRAFAAAIDPEPIMQAAFGSEEFYRLQPGILQPEQGWDSEAGTEIYAEQDLDEARRLLEESSYDGEPLVWITTREYPYMYTNATVAAQQAAEAGFNVEVEVVDYATVIERRNNAAEFDIFSGATTFTADPGIWPIWDETWGGAWVDPEKDALVEKLNTTMDDGERHAVWDEVQGYYYEESPIIKFGDLFDFSGHTDDVQGMQNSPFPAFWGVSLEG